MTFAYQPLNVHWNGMKRTARLILLLSVIVAVFVLPSGHAALTTVNYSSSVAAIPATICFNGPGGNTCSQIISTGTATVPAGTTTVTLTVPAVVNAQCTPQTSCTEYFQSWQDGTTSTSDTVTVATVASTVSFVATFATTPPSTCADVLGCTAGLGNTTWILIVIIVIALVALVYTRR